MYRNAWTIDGNLIADFITSGTMYADRIKGGTLTLGGKDDANGIMNVLDSTGETVCLLDNQSLKVFGNMVTTDFNIAYDAIDRWTAIRVMDNKKDYSVQITEISMYAFEGLGEDLNGNYSEQDPTEFYIFLRTAKQLPMLTQTKYIQKAMVPLEAI